MRHALAIAIALALTGGAFDAAAQAAPAAAPWVEATTQLPRTARPSHYTVEVTPHADKMAFDGKVRIDLEVLQPTDTLVLQAAGMRFANSGISAKGGKPMPAQVAVDEANQTASFKFAKPLAPG